MKKIIFILIFAPFFVLASGRLDSPSLNLNFDSIALPTFIKQTYGVILQKPFSLSPDLPDISVTLSANVTIDELENTLDSLLLNYGVHKNLVNGVLFFSYNSNKDYDSNSQIPLQDSNPVASPAESEQVVLVDEIQFYHPKYRRPADLQSIANKISGMTFEPTVDTVSVAGTSEQVKKILAAFALFDKPVSQVLIRGAILEYSNDESTNSGFGLAIDAFKSNLSALVGSVTVTGDYIKFSNGDFTSAISAVSGDSHFNVISRPSIRVRNGETGRIQIGESTPVLSETTVTVNSGTSQSISYRDSGVILEVKPSILGSSIELNLSQELSNFQKNNSSGIDSPVLQQRKLTSVVNINYGETIVLAGLDSSKSSNSKKGFSFLPDFAKTNSDESHDSQIILVLSVDKP